MSELDILGGKGTILNMKYSDDVMESAFESWASNVKNIKCQLIGRYPDICEYVNFDLLNNSKGIRIVFKQGAKYIARVKKYNYYNVTDTADLITSSDTVSVASEPVSMASLEVKRQAYTPRGRGRGRGSARAPASRPVQIHSWSELGDGLEPAKSPSITLAGYRVPDNGKVFE